MGHSIPWNKARWGVRREGNAVRITVLFPDEYAAMAFFDLFSDDEIELQLRGARVLAEVDVKTN